MRVAVSRAPGAERAVTPLELFFDLVYVLPRPRGRGTGSEADQGSPGTKRASSAPYAPPSAREPSATSR